jgi:hypothetical protein
MRMIQSIPGIPILALCLGAGLLAAGCDGSDGSGPAAANPHGMGIANCDALLTSAEAAEILGQPILSVTPRDTGNILNCTYHGGTAGQLLPPEIVVAAFTTDGFAARYNTTVPAYYDALDARTAAAFKTPQSGIGTKAMWMNGPAKIALYKGDVYADVFCRPHGTPIRDTSAEAQTGAKAAALKVAAKL